MNGEFLNPPPAAAPGCGGPAPDPATASTVARRAPAGASSNAPDPAASLLAAERRLPHPGLGFAVLWVLAFLGVQLGVGIVAGAAVWSSSLVRGGSLDETQLNQSLAQAEVLLVPAASLTSVLFTLLVVGVLFRGRVFQTIGWRRPDPVQLGAAIGLVLPMSVLATEVANVAGEVLPSWNGELLASFGELPLIVVFISGCLFPGISEELFCRAFLGRGLVARYGAPGGVLLTSALFGAMHLDPVQAVAAAVLGVGLHTAFLTTRSVLVPIVMHTLNNLLAFLSYRHTGSFSIPGVTDELNGAGGHVAWDLLASAALAAAMLFWLLLAKRSCGETESSSSAAVAGPSPDVETVITLPAAAAPRSRRLGLTVVAVACYLVFLATAWGNVRWAP